MSGPVKGPGAGGIDRTPGVDEPDQCIAEPHADAPTQSVDTLLGQRPRSSGFGVSLLADELNKGGSAAPASGFMGWSGPPTSFAPAPGPMIEYDKNHETVQIAKGKLNATKTAKDLDAELKSQLSTPTGRTEANAAVATDPALLDRIAKEGSEEQKRALAHSVLADRNLPDADKARILSRLTDPSLKLKDPKQKLTMDEVLANAPPEAMQGLTRGMAAPHNPEISFTVQDSHLAVVIAQRATPEAQLKVARAVMEDQNLSPAQRSAALTTLMNNTSKDGLNYLIGHADASRSVTRDGKEVGRINERQVFAGMLVGSPALAAKAGKELGDQNARRILKDALGLPVPNGQVGEALSVMLDAMTKENKNQMINHLQKSGFLRDFLETQGDRGRVEKLLCGLDGENVASIEIAFNDLASDVDPRVGHPDLIGRTISQQTSREESRTTSVATSREHTDSTSKEHTDSTSKEHTDSRSSGHEVKVEAEASVDLIVVEIGGGAGYTYKRESGSSDTTGSGTSDTRGSGTSDTTGREETDSTAWTRGDVHGKNYDPAQRDAYEAKIKEWQRTKPYLDATRQASDWASETFKSRKADREAYKERIAAKK